MAMGDKARHLRQGAAGKAKEAMGRARRDRPLESEGRRQQQTSQLKRAGDHLKAVFKR